uniref:TFIIA-alpha and beta-like factor n=1 Tax=Phallusia mammillata TaxID=59560 RepID=A0A6F9DDL1_9ASCI|nr:TFIIA-alpha and beta-like factor [Phallusia mammillata]
MAKSSNPNQVSKLYQTVIDDVINNIRESFLDDGVDEQVLQELKQTWEAKVVQSKAVQNPTDDIRHAPGAQMPMYVYANTSGGNDALPHQVVYRTIPGGQALQMTGAGQQAAMALPSSVVYQQQRTSATANQAQIYASYQPSTHQNTSQAKVVLATQKPVSSSADAGKQTQSSAVIQLDGASDCQPSTSTHCMPSREKISNRITDKKCKAKTLKFIAQVDGNVGSSSEDDDDDDDDDDEDDDEEDDEDKADKEDVVDEEPLCSDDDGSDEDPVELFDTDNVVVCQYDKIHRTKSRWKFNLKVGIMNLNGKDFVFQKANGEADW